MDVFNYKEAFLILSNFPFILAVPIAYYKKLYLDAFNLIAIAFFSSLYHSCFAFVQVFSNRLFYFSWMCPIHNVYKYGYIPMFFDMFFASANFYISISYILTTKRGFWYRYAVVSIGLFCIPIIGLYAGFFFPFGKELTNIDISNYIKFIKIEEIKDVAILKWTYDSMLVLASFDKSYYITFFSFVFINSLLIINFLGYIRTLLQKKHNNQQFNQNISDYEYLKRNLYLYYRKRFNLIWLLISFLVGFSGLFIWIILETTYPAIYEYSHSLWHLLCAISRFIFIYSIKPDGFNIAEHNNKKKKIQVNVEKIL